MALARTVTNIPGSLKIYPGFFGASIHLRSRCRVSRAGSRLSHATPRRSFTISVAAPAKQYTEDHEWIELSGDGKTGVFYFLLRLAKQPTNVYSGTIGVSKYAADALGDVVYVELPTVGLEIGAGDTIGAVESVKSASDIMTPVSGVVTEANSLLEQKPATINQSPEGDGWIAKVQIENAEEMESLMSAEEYKKFTDEVKADDEAGH